MSLGHNQRREQTLQAEQARHRGTDSQPQDRYIGKVAFRVQPRKYGEKLSLNRSSVGDARIAEK